MSGDGYSYDDARKRATAGGRWFSLKNHGDSGRFMVFENNPMAYWFDDYEEIRQTRRFAAAY